MTRKDYVAIAAAIKAAFGHGGVDYHAPQERLSLNVAAQGIADVMARDNPRFDRARFLAACGVQS